MKKSNNLEAWTQVGSSIHTLDTGPVYELYKMTINIAAKSHFIIIALKMDIALLEHEKLSFTYNDINIVLVRCGLLNKSYTVLRLRVRRSKKL